MIRILPDVSHDRERAIAILLRVGVGLSLALVAIGLGVTFARNPDYFLGSAELPALTNGTAGCPRSLGDIARALRAGSGSGVVSAGLLVLIATPVLRVCLALGMFWRDKDVAFTRITAGVLGLLLVSLLVGRGG